MIAYISTMACVLFWKYLVLTEGWDGERNHRD